MLDIDVIFQTGTVLEVAPDSAAVEEEVMTTTMEETEIVTSDETAHLVASQHISPKIHRKSIS